MHPGSPIRAILTYSLLGVPVAALVFLLTARFFSAWDGYVVAARPLGADRSVPSAYEVLVVDDAHDERVLQWSTKVVEGREIPFTSILVPPPSIPETAPHTSKSRFRLHFLVEKDGGGHEVVPTTSPSSLALALLVWLIGLAIRNMVTSGSPLSFEARATVLPAALPPAGRVADNPVSKSKQGPPPPRPRKGRGR